MKKVKFTTMTKEELKETVLLTMAIMGVVFMFHFILFVFV
mgnify:FL=1